MSPLSINNTTSKRRLISDPEEEEKEYLFDQQAESSRAIQSTSTAALSEYDLVLVALPNMVAYRMRLEHWKDFCEKNRHRYPVDPMYPYTVGPTKFVLAFFQEFVLKRKYPKTILIGVDVRT